MLRFFLLLSLDAFHGSPVLLGGWKVPGAWSFRGHSWKAGGAGSPPSLLARSLAALGYTGGEVEATDLAFTP